MSTHAIPFAVPSVASAAGDAPSVAAWHGVSKRYGDVRALDAVTLSLRPGEITALLGPNGAGKTTAVRLLLGLTRPSAGHVTVFGGSPQELATRRRVGAMLQVARVPDTLSVAEHLRLFRSYYPRPRALDDLLALSGLARERHRRFGDLSGGQRQRLLFALALCGQPDLLVLDEPTVGLDVDARRTLWAAIRQAPAAGTAVLLTTHYLEEADALSHRIVVLRRGRVVADDAPAGIKASLGSRILCCRTSLETVRLAALPGVRELQAGPPRARLLCDDPDAALRALLLADPAATGVEILSANLEDAFLAITTGEAPATGSPAVPEL